MKIQIKSDTHNEFYFNKTSNQNKSVIKGVDYVSPEADVIVLAGDIATPADVRSIVAQYGGIDQPVIYVAGNHDHWGTTIDVAKAMRTEMFAGTNIIELDASTHVIGDVAFIGATLWSDLSSPTDAALAARTRDFHEIKGMTVERWDALHWYHRAYIKQVCQNPNLKDKKKIVISHYLPSFESTPERFIGDPFNCIFSSDCEDIMHMINAPNFWVHGHTHDTMRYKKGGTEVICNPFGYSGYEVNPNYDPELIIEV